MIHVVRGERIYKAILHEAATVPQLQQNIEKGFPETKKRQHVVHEVNMIYVRFTLLGDKLQVDTVTRSHNHTYRQKLIFSNVKTVQPEQGAKFFGTDGSYHWVQPIELRASNVKVGCNCLDFHHRFAFQNRTADALSTPVPPLYQRKTTHRPPVNPLQVPGLCKHILKVVQQLEKMKIVTYQNQAAQSQAPGEQL